MPVVGPGRKGRPPGLPSGALRTCARRRGHGIERVQRDRGRSGCRGQHIPLELRQTAERQTNQLADHRLACKRQGLRNGSLVATPPLRRDLVLQRNIVHRIVADYQGEMQVRSQVGSGTTVSVRLPARVPVSAAS